MKPTPSPRKQDIKDLLKNMGGQRNAYPEELLSARRAAFLHQVEQLKPESEPSEDDEKVIQLLTAMKPLRSQYPAQLFAARRSALVRRITWMNWLGQLMSLRLAIQDWFMQRADIPWLSPTLMRTSLLIAVLVLAAWAGFLLSGDRDIQTASLAPARQETSQPAPVLVNSVVPTVEIVCKPGYEPPLCLAGEFENSQDLTLPENGSARPAVAKDTIPGYGGIHRASHVNDGQYGPGASWVSNSRNSWIKIDLGKVTSVNTVAFGRDRLGELNDRDPGQFVIALALSDDVYADGISTNDDLEYASVYDSEQAGFTGHISGAETLTAQFEPRKARFVKITFENEGTAIDEVEVFMRQQPVADSRPEKKPRDDPDKSMNTSIPTRTAPPNKTSTSVATRTAMPTDTPVPTDTALPEPTHTPVPTDTPVPPPTNTPIPTDTAIPEPSDTPFLVIGSPEIPVTPTGVP